jgi:hypothetical protein
MYHVGSGLGSVSKMGLQTSIGDSSRKVIMECGVSQGGTIKMGRNR